MSASDPFSILNRDPNRTYQPVQQSKTTVQRLRAGQVPTWALNDQAGASGNTSEFQKILSQKQPGGQLKYKGLTADASGLIIDTEQGKREVISSFIGQVDEGDERRAKIRQKMLELEKLNQANQGNNNEDDDDDDLFGSENDEGVFGNNDAKPVIVDEKGEEIENGQQLIQGGDESDKEQSNNEYEEEEHVEQQKPATLLKPVFLSKNDREALITKEKQKIEEDLQEEQDFLKSQRELRKSYTKQLVAEAIQKDMVAATTNVLNPYDSDENLPEWSKQDEEQEDRSYLNNQNAYEEWKIRELRRIKRNRDEASKRQQEIAEIERRRKLTDVERQAENLRLGSDATNKKEQVAYKFMQRFYHKGAFFRDEQEGKDNPLFARDYNMPVGEDKMDKSVLPAVLQKRRGNLGMKGQSKWTHLTNEDTTNFDPSHRVPDSIAFKTQLKQGGYKSMNQLERPSIRKRQ